MKWVYLVTTTSAEENPEFGLNMAGLEGWELVSTCILLVRDPEFVVDRQKIRYILKKPA